MNSQKQENLLNLALAVSPQERQQSLELDVGVLGGDRWELVIKYHGDFPEKLAIMEQNIGTSLQAEYLLPGYVIVTVEREYLELISGIQEVDYIEKPKALYEDATTIEQANLASCVAEVTQRSPFLTGRGVLIGIPDSGIDYKESVFLNQQGNTKIAYLWDQTRSFAGNEQSEAVRADEGITVGKRPDGFYGGTEFSREELDRSITDGTELTFDRSGHGTAIADICVGDGAAYESELLVVKLGSGNEQGFTRTTELMRAISWMLRKASELEMPLVINISYGSTYGAHDGTTLLETFLNAAADVYKTVICVGSGNEGAAAGHAALTVKEPVTVEWSVAAFQKAMNVSLWKSYVDVLQMTLVSPNGQRVIPDLQTPGKQDYELEGTRIILYVGEPTPYSPVQEYYLEFQGRDENVWIATGIWNLLLEPVRVIDGYCNIYLPAATVLNAGTNFFRATPEVTLTIPATASKVITVGAYNTMYEEYADFSGRGYETARLASSASWQAITQKPDISAPGVDILARNGRGDFAAVSGTSFATPFVSAAAALLMEWGIIRSNDPYLYGEKIKAYLRKGAVPLRGETEYPNERIGWGALCVADSIPE